MRTRHYLSSGGTSPLPHLPDELARAIRLQWKCTGPNCAALTRAHVASLVRPFDRLDCAGEVSAGLFDLARERLNFRAQRRDAGLLFVIHQAEGLRPCRTSPTSSL